MNICKPEGSWCLKGFPVIPLSFRKPKAEELTSGEGLLILQRTRDNICMKTRYGGKAEKIEDGGNERSLNSSFHWEFILVKLNRLL